MGFIYSISCSCGQGGASISAVENARWLISHISYRHDIQYQHIFNLILIFLLSCAQNQIHRNHERVQISSHVPVDMAIDSCLAKSQYQVASQRQQMELTSTELECTGLKLYLQIDYNNLT